MVTATSNEVTARFVQSIALYGACRVLQALGCNRKFFFLRETITVIIFFLCGQPKSSTSVEEMGDIADEIVEAIAVPSQLCADDLTLLAFVCWCSNPMLVICVNLW
jgi:hypothetical protein